MTEKVQKELFEQASFFFTLIFRSSKDDEKKLGKTKVWTQKKKKKYIVHTDIAKNKTCEPAIAIREKKMSTGQPYEKKRMDGLDG